MENNCKWNPQTEVTKKMRSYHMISEMVININLETCDLVLFFHILLATKLYGLEISKF